MSETEFELKQEAQRTAQLLEVRRKLEEGLPFKYGFQDYKWSREFLESRNRMCLLTAANQIGKSVTQIRKMLTWATDPALWSKLWVRRPTQFWYLYPSKDVATLEFETKWKYLLPQGELKNHPQYGWNELYDNKKIMGIQFKTGPLLVFKTYAQDIQNLQSGTVDYIGCDEEPYAELMTELFMRLAASQGYFSAVFTATIGQEYWRLAMEEKGVHEKFPNAAKWQISRYDCLHFEDGSPSAWTEESIKHDIALCSSEAEVQMRIFGKFVLAEGRVFQEFSIKNNVRHGGPIPKSWFVYSGIDYGSGGEKGHPAAIVFIAVNPEFTTARAVRAWRGDGIQTDASMILQKHRELRMELQKLGLAFMSARYDYSAKDLATIALRSDEVLQPAEKAHDIGVPIVNTLFKNQMLWLDEEQPEVMKWAFEMGNLRLAQPKNKAKDDLCDAGRYACALMPWNWQVLPGLVEELVPEREPTREERERDERRAWIKEAVPSEEELFEQQFEEVNELAGGF